MSKLIINNYPMVNPAPMILAGAEVNGRANFTAAGAFGVVCLQPIFYLSLKSSHLTTEGVKQQGFFSINLTTVELAAKADYCGMVSGRNTDKASLFNVFYNEAGRAPMIEESPMNYLCKVIKSVEVGGFDVFFGEIVATFVGEEYLTEGKPDPLKIRPIYMMGPQYFGIGEPIGGAFQLGKTLLNR